MWRWGLGRPQRTLGTLKTSIFGPHGPRSWSQRRGALNRAHGGVGSSGWGRRGVTKPPMFRQRGHGAKGLSTLVALDLHSTIGMHPFVPAQIGELGIGLQAYLTPKGFD